MKTQLAIPRRSTKPRCWECDKLLTECECDHANETDRLDMRVSALVGKVQP